MMVEAGGTEKAFEYFDAGAPKVTEEVIAGGLEAAKTWIRESIELQRELVGQAGSKPTIPYEVFVDYGEDVLARVVAVGADADRAANAITTKTERGAALDLADDEIVAELAEEFAGREREISAAVRSHTKTHRASAHRRGGHPDRRTGHRPTSVRSRRRSASSRPSTDRVFSSAVTPRCSTSRRSACRG